MTFIANNATKKSLIVVDELGRSTSTLSAVPLCYAITEYLCDMKSYTLFSTHYTDMARKMEASYPMICAHHFKVGGPIPTALIESRSSGIRSRTSSSSPISSTAERSTRTSATALRQR